MALPLWRWPDYWWPELLERHVPGSWQPSRAAKTVSAPRPPYRVDGEGFDLHFVRDNYELGLGLRRRPIPGYPARGYSPPPGTRLEDNE